MAIKISYCNEKYLQHYFRHEDGTLEVDIGNEDNVVSTHLDIFWKSPKKILEDLHGGWLKVTYKEEINVKEACQPVYAINKKLRGVYIFEFTGCEMGANIWRFVYRITSVIRIPEKSRFWVKWTTLGKVNFNSYMVLANIQEFKRYGREEPFMAMQDLISVEHQFLVNLNNVNISKDDIFKITNAWCVGHAVFWEVVVADFESLYIKIYTTGSVNSHSEGAICITGTWPKISEVLKKNLLPKEWVKEAINQIVKQ